MPLTIARSGTPNGAWGALTFTAMANLLTFQPTETSAYAYLSYSQFVTNAGSTYWIMWQLPNDKIIGTNFSFQPLLLTTNVDNIRWQNRLQLLTGNGAVQGEVNKTTPSSNYSDSFVSTAFTNFCYGGTPNTVVVTNDVANTLAWTYRFGVDGNYQMSHTNFVRLLGVKVKNWR